VVNIVNNPSVSAPDQGNGGGSNMGLYGGVFHLAVPSTTVSSLMPCFLCHDPTSGILHACLQTIKAPQPP
jgi:hypothetical protein